MATVSITFLKLSNFGGTAVANMEGVLGESITSSATSQQSTNSATDVHDVVRISVSGGSVWVRVGNDPTAAAGDDLLILDGETEFFAVNTNDEVAIIDV